MSETAKDGLIAAETDLIALVSSEQRGFRRILFAGLATLIVLVLMSAALGVYYFEVSKSLAQASDPSGEGGIPHAHPRRSANQSRGRARARDPSRL